MSRLEPLRQQAARARTWIDAKPSRSRAVAYILGAASVALLLWAASLHSALILVLVSIGSVLGSFAIWIVGRLAALTAKKKPALLRLLGPVLVGAGLAVALGAATVGARLSSLWTIRLLILVAVLALVSVMVGILMINQRVADLSVSDPKLWFVASAVVFFTALLAIGTGTPAHLTAIALLVWVVSLTFLKISLAPLIRTGPPTTTHRNALVVVVVSTLVVVVGLALLIWNPLHDRLGPEPFATTFSVSLVLLALSTAAIGAVNLDMSQRPGHAWVVLGVGVVATVVGAWWSSRSLPDWPVVLAFLWLLMFLVGAFFVLKGEGLVFLIVLAFVLALVLMPREAGDPVDDNVGETTLLVLGDSFTSGEGATSFLADTNTQDPTGNWCRRAPRSYGQLVGEHFDFVVHNYSCSGAVTSDITTVGQHARTAAVPFVEQVTAGQLPQLDSLTKFGVAPESIDLVLMSIGGNDAGFATVVQACLLPSDCQVRGGEWLGQAAAIRGAVDATFGEIAATLPNAEIVVLPYPNYVGTTRCGLALTTDEISFVRQLIATINAQIEAAAGGHDRVRVFPEIDRAYLNNDLCSGSPGANFLNLLPRGGNLTDRFAPDSWHNGTAHPNERGHRCTAAVLAPWLQGQFDWIGDPPASRTATPIDADGCKLATTEQVQTVLAGAPMGDVDPAPLITDPADEARRCVQDLEVAAEGRIACFDGGDWVSAQLDSTTNKLALPFALLVLGGLLVALALVWRVHASLHERRSHDPTAEIEPRPLDALVPEPAYP